MTLILTGFNCQAEVEIKVSKPIFIKEVAKEIYSPNLLEIETELNGIKESFVVENASCEPTYSEEDLDLLARLIHAEVGCSWMSDELQMSVGNVVLNRVNDGRFPNSIEKVIYQKGQYACIKNGMIDKEPSEQAINNARRLLQGERVLPENVIWQSEFSQGNKVYKTYSDDILGNTTYFCY